MPRDFLSSLVLRAPAYVRNTGDTTDVISLLQTGEVSSVMLRATAASSKAFYTDGEYWTLHTALRADNPSGGGMLQIGSTGAPTTDEQLVKFIYGACTSTTSTRLWDMGKNSTTMTLSGNAGADFVIRNYTDAGALIGTPLSIQRSTGDATFGSTVITKATATGGSGLRLPHGTAPTSPVNGDIWTTSAGGLYARINGTTVGPLNTNGPATTVTTLTGLQSGVVGTSLLYARQDHQHTVAGVVDTSTTQSSVGGAKTFTSLLSASAGVTVTGAKTTVAATAAGYASLNLPAGTAPSTPAAGDIWATSSGIYHSVGVASNTTRIPGTVDFARCSSNSAAATTGTYVIPTGFPSTIPLKNGRTYKIEVIGFYQCAATTYAPRHRFQYPALTAGSMSMISFSGASTSTQTGSAVTLGASPTTFVSANAGGANTSYYFKLEGFMIPSADGNLIYDFTPNSAGTMTIMAGTTIMVTEVE